MVSFYQTNPLEEVGDVSRENAVRGAVAISGLAASVAASIYTWKRTKSVGWTVGAWVGVSLVSTVAQVALGDHK